MTMIHSNAARTLVVATLGLAAGCAGDGGTAAADPAVAELQQADDTIHGTDFTRFRLAGEPVRLKAVDLSSARIEAHVERDGAFDVRPGVGHADGTFEVAGVPRGARYWLRVGTNWYLTRQRVVDIGTDALGRPDAVGADPGTSLVFDVDGLTPVTSGDDFQLEAPGAQVGFYSTASFLNPITANAPAVGATTLDDAVFPFDADAAAGTSQFPLAQASQGDTLTLAQLTTRQLGSLSYQSLARALTTSVEMVQGAATTVSGTMTTPPTSVIPLDLEQGAFEALADDVRHGATPRGASALIDASPGGERVNLGTPDLAIIGLPAGAGNQVLPLELGNPYPSIWPLFGASSFFFSVPFLGVAADGTAVQRRVSSTSIVWEFVERGRVTLAPVISPVRDLAVDGQPATDAQATFQPASANPTVSWDPPRQGEAAAYIIRVVHAIGQAPFRSTVGRLVVRPDARRVQIPDGLLQPGEHYYFQVVAVASSQPRTEAQLEILFVPPDTQIIDAFSNTIQVE